MNDEIENVRRLLLQNKHPSYQTTDHKEVRVVCPYCDDGRHKDAGKFYIAMKPPFMFHCKRCETSGVLNQKVLRDLGIYDNTLNESIILSNKEYHKNQGVQHISFKGRTLKNDSIDSNQTNAAVEYFNNRYGSNYTPEEIINKFKCVLDAPYFFRENNIYAPKIFDFSNSIGFISSDSTHIIFRDISGKQKLRYSNLRVDKISESASKIYNISGDIDIMQPVVNLVITEGSFDIIGVYTHFYKNTQYEKNTIFATACGKSYNAVILNYIRLGFLNLNISIYSDGDVDVNFYRELKNSNPYLKGSNITIFYNDLYDPSTGYGKDYGVKKEDIKLRKVII